MKKAEVCPPYFSESDSIISAFIMAWLSPLPDLLSKSLTILIVANGENERVKAIEDTHPTDTRIITPTNTGEIDRESDDDPVTLNSKKTGSE